MAGQPDQLACGICPLGHLVRQQVVGTHQPLERSQRLAASLDPALDSLPLALEERDRLRLVGDEQLVHVRQGNVERAQERDRDGGPGLAAVVVAVARIGIHVGGGEQAQLVVAAQLLDAEAHPPCEFADPDQLMRFRHAPSIEPAPRGESSAELDDRTLRGPTASQLRYRSVRGPR